MSDVTKVIAGWIRNNGQKYICVTGVHGLTASMQNQNVYQAHKNASLIVPDGMPLVWLSKLNGQKQTERIYGPDLMKSICQKAAEKGWRIFLYGTTEKTLIRLRNNLEKEFPGLEIAGLYSPPFKKLTGSELNQIVERINKVRPKIVFIGLSTPKQELFMHEVRPFLKAPVLIGVGAAFDFLSGTKKQAPLWMRKAGLEWFFRLVSEPGRLGKRYLINNTLFFWYLLVWFTRKHFKH
jgi:N-acetylglucosaminyldiphosphoundecaprenol N-acetyl-beta-D-mannosaminyltransferase